MADSIEKELTKEQVSQFVEEMKTLCRKYNLHDVSFCASNGKKYLAMICIDVKKLSGFLNSVLNVGRLWQSGREKVKGLLDDFEKW